MAHAPCKLCMMHAVMQPFLTTCHMDDRTRSIVTCSVKKTYGYVQAQAYFHSAETQERDVSRATGDRGS